MAAQPDSEVDMLLGIGGSPAGVLGACAVKCLGGAFFGRLTPRDDAERRQCVDRGIEVGRLLTVDDVIRGGEVHFAATGITDGELLTGVRFTRGRGGDELTGDESEFRHGSGPL